MTDEAKPEPEPMGFRHWMAHKLGQNTGKVDVFWQGQRLMVGFRCDGCGRLSGVHESVTTRQHPPGTDAC